MKRHKHLWSSVVDLVNLHAAAREAMKGKRSKHSGAGFFGKWETEIVALQRELMEGSYRPGAYYYFPITEPKPRIIAAAPFRDRVVHHALVRVLEPIFERRFIEDSFACRKEKGTHAGMRRALEFSKRWPVVLKCDIRRYFPSIRQDKLLEKVERVVGDDRVVDLVGKIVASHVERVEQKWQTEGDLFSVQEVRRGLPIGNLTSQFCANIYLDGFDHFVKQALRVKGYVRYVDDFLIFGESRSEVREWGRKCREYLAGEGLEIHPDKYRVCRTGDGVDFCGYVVRSDGRVRLRKAGVRRFQKRMRRMRMLVGLGILPKEDLRTSMMAWIGHAEQALSWSLRWGVFNG